MVTRDATFWLADKFSFSAPEEMCNEQCGEYAYLCQGEKGVYEKKKVIVWVEREKRPSKLETKY